jgi:uncharacterized protein YjbI with pentapeptide repeats
MLAINVILAAILLCLMNCSSARYNDSYETNHINSSEVAANLLDGKTKIYENKIIEGDIDLNDKLINISSDVKMINCTINGTMDFEYITFLGLVDFRETTFCGDTRFNFATFHKPAIFSDTKFLYRSEFQGSRFGSVDFRNSRFMNDAEFRFANFNEEAIFTDAEFLNTTTFSNAQFHDSARFWKTCFEEDVRFANSSFGREAEFWGARFSKNADFTEAKFESRALFNAKQIPTMPMDGAVFSGDMILNGSIIDKLMLHGSKFDENSSLFLDDCDYNILLVNWSEIKNNLVYKKEDDGAIYLKLISNFNNRGYFSDADECYYQYRNERRNSEQSVLPKTLDTLAWITCGYGVRPQYAIRLSIILILLFAGFYWMQPAAKNANASKSKSIIDKLYLIAQDLKRRSIADLESWIFFSLRVFTFQSKVERVAGSRMKYVVALEGIIGLLLFAIFIASLTSVFMR